MESTIQAKYDLLLAQVAEMRGMQRRVEQYPGVSSDRQKKRYLEGKVDKLITAEIERVKSKQGEIF